MKSCIKSQLDMLFVPTAKNSNPLPVRKCSISFLEGNPLSICSLSHGCGTPTISLKYLHAFISASRTSLESNGAPRITKLLLIRSISAIASNRSLFGICS